MRRISIIAGGGGGGGGGSCLIIVVDDDHLEYVYPYIRISVYPIQLIMLQLLIDYSVYVYGSPEDRFSCHWLPMMPQTYCITQCEYLVDNNQEGQLETSLLYNSSYYCPMK